MIQTIHHERPGFFLDIFTFFPHFILFFEVVLVALKIKVRKAQD